MHLSDYEESIVVGTTEETTVINGEETNQSGLSTESNLEHSAKSFIRRMTIRITFAVSNTIEPRQTMF